MSIGLPDFDRPRQLDQPFEIGARHRIFAGRLGHALEPGELALGVVLDLGRHLGLGDLSGELGDLLALGVVALAQFLLDRLHLLAQQELALAVVDLFLGLLADLARQPQHLGAVGQHRRHPFEPALDIDGFEDLLLFGRGDVHKAGDQVGEGGGGARLLHGVDQLDRGLRQQLQHLDRLIAQVEHPRFDVLAGGVALGHALDPGHQKRVAVEKIENAKAPLALADHMMLAVGARYIAQDVGFGAHAVQIDRDRVLDHRVALQHQPDRPVEPDRGLCRGNRALAPQGHWQHGAGKQHQAAGRHQDQRIGGERRDAGQRGFDGAGGR